MHTVEYHVKIVSKASKCIFNSIDLGHIFNMLLDQTLLPKLNGKKTSFYKL